MLHVAGYERIWSTLGGMIANVAHDVEDLYIIFSNINLSKDDYSEEEEQSTNEEVQDVELPEKETFKIEELLNLNSADFTRNLDEMIFDTNLELSEEEDIHNTSNDAENNIDEGNWDPKREIDTILD
ncbi:30195_t:CDS:2 [Gigaspora margarita]|uniref:30195_t:CDS:1 n=1 Tax=Gigaspora margarita TaxID=4874 RepID=A0ABN7W4T3_GIGMA|nr:30195_t:CDS:2 [Gigaspora margarita]